MADSRHWQYVRVNFCLQKFTIYFSLWNINTKQFAVLLKSISLHKEKIAPPYTSPYLGQNLLSGWLWVPIL